MLSAVATLCECSRRSVHSTPPSDRRMGGRNSRGNVSVAGVHRQMHGRHSAHGVAGLMALGTPSHRLTSSVCITQAPMHGSARTPRWIARTLAPRAAVPSAAGADKMRAADMRQASRVQTMRATCTACRAKPAA